LPEKAVERKKDTGDRGELSLVKEKSRARQTRKNPNPTIPEGGKKRNLKKWGGTGTYTGRVRVTFHAWKVEIKETSYLGAWKLTMQNLLITSS